MMRWCARPAMPLPLPTSPTTSELWQRHLPIAPSGWPMKRHIGRRLQRRLEAIASERNEAARARVQAEVKCDVLRAELAAMERQLAMVLPGDADTDHDPAQGVDLDGRCILYVGGRTRQIPRLKSLIERTNGRFLHHDGGLEHNAALIPGLVSRADLVVFPVDCVSHDAAGSLKRTCRQLGKRYVPLRTSSLAGLVSGLAAVTNAAAPDCGPVPA
jgi:hypothetical protein